MKRKTILIAEASVELSQVLVNHLAADYSVQVCHSGVDARRLVNELQPDAVVMDLMLPGVDGITLLKHMVSQPDRPKILLTTCLVSPYVETAIASCNVDMVVVKPCEVTMIVDRIGDLLTQGAVEAPQLVCTNLTTADILLKLDMSPKRKAFEYIQMCAELYEANPCQGITKSIYPQVAKAYGTNPWAVERAIRQIVHESWEHRDELVWRRYFRTDRSGNVARPTNAEFISRLAEIQRRIAQ